MSRSFALLLACVACSYGVAHAASTVMVDLRPSLSGTNSGQPFLRGSTGKVDLYMENCPGQFCTATDRTSVYLHLPPGLSYAGHQGFNPTWVTCSAGPALSSGQTVRCTGGGLSGNPNAVTKYSGVIFDVTVAADAPLGAAPIHAAVDEALPDDSTTLPPCMLDPAPIWCDVMDPGIATVPQPELVLEQGSFSGSGLAPGDETGTVTATFRNLGAAAAQHTHLQIQLPRGVYWRAGGNASGPGPFQCSSSGSVDPGIVLVCSSTTPLPAGGTGFLRLGLNPGVLAAASMPVLYAIDALAAPAPDGLDRCAADPSRADCLLIEVPMRNGCASRYGADGIYCNGYETAID